MLRKSALCTGKIRHRCISNAGVELHIRNQIQSLGQLFLRDIVAHCRIQDQIKDRFHICIGYAKSEVAFQTKLFVQKELDIRGSRNALPTDFRAVINYMKEGNCPVEELISKVAKPEGALEAMQEWAANPGKVFRILVEF